MYSSELERGKPITSNQGVVLSDVEFEPGEICTRFFSELMDGRVFGVRCDECGVTYVPPRNSCQRCFAKLEQWVELPGEGELVTFTVVRSPAAIQPAETPYVLGIIKLDGADTGLVHLVSCDPETVEPGMRLRAVFADERHGNIRDISHFAPMRE